MRKFVCIPNHFRGLSDISERDSDSNKTGLIFSRIIDNQVSCLRVCYRKAEFLFTRLSACLDQFRDWIVLGNINLDDLVDSHCRDLVDFERNFKVSNNRCSNCLSVS